MHLPYQLDNTLPNNLLSFTTDKGLIYYVRFHNHNKIISPLVGIYDINFCEIEFQRHNPLNIPNKTDNRITATICKIIEDYFSSGSNQVLMYICDAGDGKEKGRDKIFERWHNCYMAHYLNRTPLVIEIGDDFIPIYACILTRKDFEHMNIIETEIVNESLGIISSKYGAE